MPTPRLGSGLVVLALIATVGLSGCTVRGLAFKHDDRIEITSPKEDEHVRLPFTVEWTVRDVDDFYAIFFDRAPMKPGQDLLSLVPEDDECRRLPGCPDVQWLEDNGPIYITDEPNLLVRTLLDLRPNDRSEDRHLLTLVLLDPRGRRIGEATFVRAFVVERTGAGQGDVG